MVPPLRVNEFPRIPLAYDIDNSDGSRLSTSAVRARTIARVISPQAGRALEILGHAIEYLVDEYVHNGGGFCEDDPEVAAVRILINANREVYFSCPLRPTFFERLFRKLSKLGL
jgi:hypothetical protein